MDGRLLVWIAIGALAAWLWLRFGRRERPEHQLRRICRGDDGQAERLIAGELTRAPHISRDEAARRALDRYRRDNR